MQLIKFSVVLLLVLAVANCFDEPYSMQYSYLPDVQLGTFEGSYTSSPPGGYGYGLWMCQDENVVFGSYDEVGIFNGQVQAGNVLNGTWYEAGTGSCVTGTFAITLTSWGFDGWYDCAGNSNLRYNWTETKINAFRPSDGDCAIMDLSSTHALSGRFEDENQLPKDFCYDSSLSNATISFLYMEDDGTTQKGYFEGTAYQNGQIFIGTWYTPTPSAGANLYYLDENGLVHCFFWTGLNGTTGDTVINPAEYFQEEKHFHVHYTGPISATSSSNCKDYSLIKNTVLNNLVDGNPNDNHYYYFVTSDFYNFDYVYNVTASSASSIQVFYLLSFVLALFLF